MILKTTINSGFMKDYRIFFYIFVILTSTTTIKVLVKQLKNWISGDKVAVDFDAGQNSVAIVKLINSSLDEKNVKVKYLIFWMLLSSFLLLSLTWIFKVSFQNLSVLLSSFSFTSCDGCFIYFFSFWLKENIFKNSAD